MTQRQSQVKVLSTHQFAQLCRTTTRTIRFYDKLGLLKPSKVDEWTRYRYYKASQARDFFKILLLQHFDISLKDIHKSLKARGVLTLLDSKVDTIEAEIQEKKKELAFLKEIKNALFEDGIKRQSQIERYGPYILFCHSISNGRFDQINNYIWQLRKIAQDHNVHYLEKQMVTYLDPPDTYKPRNAKLEISLICKRKTHLAHLPATFNFKTFPRQVALTYTYKGPFEYLTFIHQKLYESISHKKLLDNPFDIHYYGPWNRSSQYDYLTKVAYPVNS